MTLLAFFVHAVVNHKFAAHAIVIVVYTLAAFLTPIGVEHEMLHLMTVPDIHLSDMNGYGPYLHPAAAYSVYWLSFGVLLTALAVKAWKRGTETSLRLRWRAGKLSTASRRAAVAAGCLFALSGVYILYNTLVLHSFQTVQSRYAEQARYEKEYKLRFGGLPQPRVTALTVDVRLYPERQQYEVRGQCRLVNRMDTPIGELVVDVDADLRMRSLTLDRPFHPGLTDKKLGLFTLKLENPLPPGQTMTLDFDEAYDRRGFANGAQQTSIAANGTFLSHIEPHFGYQPGSELSDNRERRRRGLPERTLMPPLTDVAARRNTYLNNDSDWISYDAIVRTAPDQVAVTPGNLVREWSEGGRRCFHYKMDTPIRYFVNVVSARYRVLTDSWVGKEGKRVAIAIYYHPGHEYNLPRMVKGAKMALAYCSEQFSPYQFQQLRIVEFPDYIKLAQSFPNTISYSEGIGFLARVRDRSAAYDGDIDYPFYVTAHEVAHQWWGQQLLGANMEGSEMLSESLAEYTALMVMERAYGKGQIRRFLRLNLDEYLRGRGTDEYGERPLVKSQHQAYIHYNKGALVWYGVRERMGERALNGVLSRFIEEKGFQSAPYTTSEELVARLRAAAPAEMQGFITDAFEKITLFTCWAHSAEELKTKGGWRVTLHASVEKHYADASGNTSPGVLNDWVAAAVFGKARPGSKEPGKLLAIERRRVTRYDNDFTFTVAEEPAQAGIDPNFTLVDRYPDYHLVSVTPHRSTGIAASARGK